MRRRPVDLDSDAEILMAMQRRSLEINFPQYRTEDEGFLARLKTAARRDQVYVYEDESDGKVVAWLWLDLERRRTCHISHIQVVEERWGQGIGRYVMQDAMRMALKAGRRYMTLAVTKSNRRAMALYEGLGFTVETDSGERQSMRLDLLQNPPPEDDSLKGPTLGA